MSQWTENLITVEQGGTLDGLFLERLQRSPDKVAYRSFYRHSKSWHDYSWREMAEQVGCWQEALKQEGLATGDRVAVLLRNCPEWVVFDQASLGSGLVVVPLYTDDRPDNVAYILKDADIKLLLVQDAGRWKRLAQAVTDNESLQRVLVLEPSDEASRLAESDGRVMTVDQWLPEGIFLPLVRNGDPHELASIVYTSGTTGRPKGVMLSHHNMMSVAHAGLTMIDVYEEDLFLSFLPLSHTLERSIGYYLTVMTGSTVAFSRSVGQLAEDLQIIRPTIMIAVPRIFERVYGRVKDQLEKRPKLAQWLFTVAVNVGWRRFLRDQKRGHWHPSFIAWRLLQRLVAAKIVDRLGGRLRFAVSGGAPLSPDIAQVFIGLGIPILQGYGLTETSPVISVNSLARNEPASVGMPLRGTQVRIGADDELQVKGPGVMLGYWNNHAATAQMIDSEGWLQTGDQARLAGDHIYITGRIKDILILSNGEKVPPSDMELAIALDPVVEQVMVVGEGKPYLSAVVVLDGEHWPGFAQDCGVDPMEGASLLDSKVISKVLKRIKVSLKDFPGYAKIRRVSLTLEPWTVDNGLLTPTLKAKRPKVIERFATEIASMYE